jgi:hypothetical protein
LAGTFLVPSLKKVNFCVSKLKKPLTSYVKGFMFAVWTGLELLLKTPCLQGLPGGLFLGSPQGSPFNISLTFRSNEIYSKDELPLKGIVYLNFGLSQLGRFG